MKRVAILLSGIKGTQRAGGAERAIIKLANGMAEKGYAVGLIVFRSNNLLAGEISKDVHLMELETNNFFVSILKLHTYLKRYKPIAIFAQDNRALAIAQLSKKIAGVDASILVTIHGTLSQRWCKFGNIKRYLAVKMMRPFFLHANAVICVSNAAADDLKTFLKLPSNLVKTIYNPIISPDIYKKAKENPTIPLFNNNGYKYILSAGRLSKEKDFNTLLRAFSLVRKKTKAKLIILGAGDERENLQCLADELNIADDVMMPGFVNNPYPYMAKADIFVLSSKWEGLPTVLVEALALGKPLVSTNCCSGPSEILENGKWGSLVPVGEPEPMAGAIIEKLNSSDRPIPFETLDRFSVEKNIKEYISLINS